MGRLDVRALLLAAAAVAALVVFGGAALVPAGGAIVAAAYFAYRRWRPDVVVGGDEVPPGVHDRYGNPPIQGGDPSHRGGDSQFPL
jgi:hypothetical protein